MTTMQQELIGWLKETGFPDYLDYINENGPEKTALGMIEELEYASASTDDPREIGDNAVYVRWLRDYLARWEGKGE